MEHKVHWLFCFIQISLKLYTLPATYMYPYVDIAYSKYHHTIPLGHGRVPWHVNSLASRNHTHHRTLGSAVHNYTYIIFHMAGTFGGVEGRHFALLRGNTHAAARFLCANVGVRKVRAIDPST